MKCFLRSSCALLILSLGCSRPAATPEKVEQTPAAVASKPFTQVSAQPIAPPTEAEARDAVARIYGNAVSLDQSRQSCVFAGDFNNDGSEDLAVIVLPNRKKLKELNNELANWILEDPQTVVLPDPKRGAQPLSAKPPKTQVIAGEVLLAVIHGHQAEGWRNPQAQQTYLLKHAVGSGIAVVSIGLARRELQKENKAWTIPSQAQGQALQEDLNGHKGFLHWTGGQYVFGALSQ